MVKCQYCDSIAELVSGSYIYPCRSDLCHHKFWLCSKCDAYVGCHEGTIEPLGTLANAETRKMRRKAHSVFDTFYRSQNWSRTSAYTWLSTKMKLPLNETHIGNFDPDQCQQVINICKVYPFK